MDMLVLAGGFGTRLQSVIADVPKALAPIGATPFLRLQIEHWLSQGLRSFVFLLHHQADLIVDFLRREKHGLLRNADVQWLVEPRPLGTGGAVAYAIDRLKLADDFLVTNADTWIGSGVREVGQACSPSMAVVTVNDAGRYGSVQFDEQKCISGFAEKSAAKEAGWINAGLCRLNPGHFKNFEHSAFSLERDLFPALVCEGTLFALPLATDFIDIGVPDDYYRFCRWIETGRGAPLCN